ncbi:MAG: SelT/SelW/SelH family protein [Thermoplasmata archaeon]|uniref:Rdx family protein n=1 Tax=Candidatus Sysuiplasma superficiale TaxID=2823368 RepID=A0A8J7YPK6_9ARCH|nr:Rdx family protein [Candidatus Sysuiplasma superficiale]MBX8644160.1 SelT/SelW/SelH family protein [Candidatus Sysuiplasma superficiale]
MKNVTVKYCQPCGFMPRALDLSREILQAFGMAYNKKFSLNLQPGDKGIFEVLVGDHVIFSKEKAGRYPEPAEIIESIRKEIDRA